MFKKSTKNDVTVNNEVPMTPKDSLKCGVAYELGVIATGLALSLLGKGVKKAAGKIKENKESEDK